MQHILGSVRAQKRSIYPDLVIQSRLPGEVKTDADTLRMGRIEIQIISHKTPFREAFPVYPVENNTLFSISLLSSFF